MAGTKDGGKKTAAANKAKHGSDFYTKICRKGGSAKHKAPRWFEAHPELAKKAGAREAPEKALKTAWERADTSIKGHGTNMKLSNKQTGEIGELHYYPFGGGRMSHPDINEIMHAQQGWYGKCFYDDNEPNKDQDIIDWLKSENAYLRGKIEVYEKFLKDKVYINEEE